MLIKMKRAGFIPILVVLVGFMAFEGQAQRLTLEDAVGRALEVSEELRISQEEVRKCELQASEAGSRRLPRLDFSGQYIFTSEVMSLDQPPTTVNLGTTSLTIPGSEISFGDEHTVDFKLQVTQPLFTGFGLKKTHQAKRREVLAKQSEYDRTRWEIRWQAEEVYRRAQKAAETVKIARLQVGTLERHLADAQRRVEQGVAPLEVTARAKYALSRARLQLQEAENADQLAQFALRELLDLPEEGEHIELDSLRATFLVVEVPEALEYARRHRVEFKTYHLQRDVLSELVGVRQASYYPSLFAFGALNYGRPGVDRLANDWMFYQTAGLSLNWTLWDWKGRHNRIQEVKAARRQIDESLKALESRVRLEVQAAQRALQDAAERVDIAIENVQLSRDIQRWVEARYRQGTATEKEYLDALDDYHGSEIQSIVAYADYWLALLELKRASGGGLINLKRPSPIQYE